jgi:hypothetical protein
MNRSEVQGPCTYFITTQREKGRKDYVSVKKFSYYHNSIVGLDVKFDTLMAAAQSSNTIYSCVTNNNGAVRIVSATTTCTSKEHSVIWSVTGPQGPQGPIGLAPQDHKGRKDQLD